MRRTFRQSNRSRGEAAWRQRQRWVAAALLTIVTIPSFGADGMRGKVVDKNGLPVAGAQVGSSFRLLPAPAKPGVQIGYGDPPILSDLNGRFLIPADVAASIEYSKVLVAAGPDGSLGFAAKSTAAPNVIRLSTPATIAIHIAKPFGHARATYSFDLLAKGSAIGYGEVPGGSARFLAPPGSMELAVSDSESKTATTPLALSPAKMSSVPLELHPTLWAATIGKQAPPFSPTEMRNWPDGLSLSALRGKWVLVDYWATWCQPCVAEMPRLIKFYQDHSADRARFEIVAIHSPDGRSFSDIQSAYARLRTQIWGGQALPFPMMFDSTGATHRAWGIETYPTTLLLDPSGNLVGEGTITDLAQKLGI